MYNSVLSGGEGDFVEKKSRFIGGGYFEKSEEEALNKISQIKEIYKDATHNTYAYIIGKDAKIQRYSDDGEPQGTAGIPMLEVLKKEEMRNVLVTGTRYFGGILLGSGGLLRAYTKCARLGLLAAKKVVRENFNRTKFSYDYTYHGKILNYLTINGYKILQEDFTDIASLTLYVKENAPIIKDLKDMTGAKIKIEVKACEELPTIDGKIMRWNYGRIGNVKGKKLGSYWCKHW